MKLHLFVPSTHLGSYNTGASSSAETILKPGETLLDQNDTASARRIMSHTTNNLSDYLEAEKENWDPLTKQHVGGNGKPKVIYCETVSEMSLSTAIDGRLMTVRFL